MFPSAMKPATAVGSLHRADEQPTGAVEKVPTRAQIAVEDTWDLSALYADDLAWEQEFARYQLEYPKISRFMGRLADSSEALAEALEFENSVDFLCSKLHHYAGLKSSEDSSDNTNLSREARLQSAATRAAELSAFMTPEIQAIPDERWEQLLAADVLGVWRSALRKIRRNKPHTLTASEERLMALAAEPLGGFQETFSQLTNVDLKFGSLRDDRGRERELSHGSFASFLQSREPAVRREAFHRYYQVFDAHKFTLSATLAHSVKTGVFQARARHYSSALEAALFHDDIPAVVYDNLIASVRSGLEPLYRYYALRQELLGLEEIHHYDTYVPMVGGVETDYSFDEAAEMVLEALQPLGEEYVTTLRQGMASRWCDRYESAGKRSGAFSWSSYGAPPYILMNYKRDVFSDVYTLAHEVGHSMHSWFSNRAQSFQDSHYSIFVAEVASTFNEELLTHYLLTKTEDPRMRAYIINRQLDDIRGTIYRQTMFAEFEKRIHAAQEAGEALTLDYFRGTYRELLNTWFGSNFSLDTELELECFRIPHFYSAFYVYKYATGLSAALALANKVLSGETGAVESYLKFLSLGGSVMPLEALGIAGVNMASPEPVRRALGLFSRRVDELTQWGQSYSAK